MRKSRPENSRGLFRLPELSNQLHKRLTLFDDVVDQKVDILGWRFSTSMRRFWRDLERLARLVHLGLLPLHAAPVCVPET